MPAQCDAGHDPCRVQGRQARAWRLRRGVVARDRADPRQAKEVARELMTRCGTWHAPASKSTRDTVDACPTSKLEETRVRPVFGGVLCDRVGVTVYTTTRVNLIVAESESSFASMLVKKPITDSLRSRNFILFWKTQTRERCKYTLLTNSSTVSSGH